MFRGSGSSSLRYPTLSTSSRYSYARTQEGWLNLSGLIAVPPVMLVEDFGDTLRLP